jgi:hypothetical protein
MKAEDLAKL